MTKTTTIKDTIRRRSQSWTREVTINLNGHKVRAHVTRDSYDEQSRIHCEVFSPAALDWNRIESRAGTEAAHLPKIYGIKDDQQIIAASQDLIDSLFDYARQILT